MKTGTIIAVVLVVLLIGGVIWYMSQDAKPSGAASGGKAGADAGGKAVGVTPT